MKVSINWLKELVDLKIPVEELIRLLPLRTIGLKDITKDYLELDMKGYNRADLLYLRGIALEVAAISNSQITFREPQNNEYIWYGQNLPSADVRVVSKVAPVYCIAEITGLKVEKSPEEWQKNLRDCGIRPVNNIADITNLVMLEYGQPLHAFDAQKSQGIHVYPCYYDEPFVTLDGKERILKEGDILIWGNSHIIGLGGIMGGKNSEVTKETNSIHLEAAIFDPIQIRKTATRLGLQSEASKRFYHGLTKKRLFQALSAAIKMYEGIGGKLTALTIVDNLNQPTVTINLTQTKINSLIGVDISQKEVDESLKKLGFKLASHIGSGNVVWSVTVPYWRLDINIEEDLIEEVVRMHGYEKISAKPLNTNIPASTPNPLFDLLWRLKQALFRAGLTEVQTYSYYSTNVLNVLGFDDQKKERLIKVANPISSESEYLRENIWPNLVEVVAKNVKQGFKNIAIFEIGKTYLQKEGLPKEPYRLAIALSNNSDNPLAELYQILQNLPRLNLNQGLTLTNKYFHPTRFKLLGETSFIAEIHPRLVNKFGIEQRVAVSEIKITKLL